MRFGYELEFFGANIPELVQKSDSEITLYRSCKPRNYQTFGFAKEVGITDQNFNGGELISPIYTTENLRKCYDELKQMLELLQQNGAYLLLNSFRTGFHIHQNREIFCSDWHRYQIFFQFFLAFQQEIFDFAKGEHDGLRYNFYEHSAPLDKGFVDHIISREEYDQLALNLLQVKSNCIRFTPNTLELRFFNSSFEFQTLKSFLQFSKTLGEFIQSGVFDEELIQYYYQNYENIGLRINPERKRILFEQLKY